MRLGGLVLVGALALTGCTNPPPVVSVPRVTVTTLTLRTLPPGQSAATPVAGADPTVPAAAPPDPGPSVPAAAPPAGQPAAGAAFCGHVRRYTDLVNQLNASPSASQLRQLVVDVTAAIEAAAATAPAPVNADVTVMAGAHRRFLTALEQAGFDPARLPPGTGAELQSAPYLAAKARVRDFNRQNC